jgi:hypothetical protein
MKDKLLVKLGKRIMRAGRLRICVVDDKRTYFHENMLATAKAAGFSHITRYYVIDEHLLQHLLISPPDIIILDIKGVADKRVAKDGFGIAKLMFERTNTYVVITSAHRFYLRETHTKYDYLIENRFLTSVDFVEELAMITDKYLKTKIRFWGKLVFRLGFFLAKKALMRTSV